MADPPEQIRKHIQLLWDFEQKYGEFLVARHNRRVEDDPQWSRREWAERERALRMLAPRAEAAMEASGLGSWQQTWPLALGGGVKSDDLSMLIFDFQNTGFSIDASDDEMQRDILAKIPSQIAGLEMRLEKAEAERARAPRLFRDSPLPRLFSRIAALPPWIGFIADLITVVGFTVVAIGAIGHFAGLW